MRERICRSCGKEYDKHGKTGRWDDIWKNQKGTIYGRSIGVLVETAKRSLAVHAANGKKEVTQRKMQTLSADEMQDYIKNG